MLRVPTHLEQPAKALQRLRKGSAKLADMWHKAADVRG